MNRNKIALSVLVGLFAIAMVTAGVLTFMTERDAEVSSSMTMSGGDSTTAMISGGESVSSGLISLESQTSVNVPLLISTNVMPGTSEAETTNLYHLNASNTSKTGDEDRVSYQFTDLGVETLSDLQNMSWDVQNGQGYAPHVDVFLDNGESLAFEYAKADPLDCDDSGDYPTGDFSTFNDKGIIDSNAYAWESIPGPCGDSTFDAQHKSLADWKSTYPNAKIEKIELEIDNWVMDSKATVKNVEINGQSVMPTLLPQDDLDFEAVTEFSIAVQNDTYTLTTEVKPDTTRVV